MKTLFAYLAFGAAVAGIVMLTYCSPADASERASALACHNIEVMINSA